MALQRTSSAEWQGDLRGGKGVFQVGEGAFSGAYTFASRFEDGDGTNPEELLAAAHAACYAMALSNELDGAGHTPESVTASATATLDTDQGAITTIHLDVEATVPGIDEDTFRQLAAGAKDGCPVSKLYQGAEITLDAELVA